MSQVLHLPPPPPPEVVRGARLPARRSSSLLPPLYGSGDALAGSTSIRWSAIREEANRGFRHYCFFADDRKKEQARKALENALGGKKNELEKWSKEIEKRQEKDGKGMSGRGGWFGGGGWLGWFGGDNFWEEAQQAILTILGIVFLYLLLAKGDAMFAVVSNSILFVLRGVRNGLTFILSCFSSRTLTPASGSLSNPDRIATETAYQTQLSAKERVIRKWGMD